MPGQGEGGSNYHYFGRLGRWLDNQRQFKKNNKLPAEREAQIQILVDEGKMYWDASSLSASGKFKVLGGHDWLRHYAALVEYGKEHGHCNVPQKSPYECDVPQDNVTGDAFHYNGKLGRWLDNQRQFKKVHGGKLTTDREALLQILVDEGKLGWGVGDDSSKRTYQMDLVWPKHYAALLEYGREFGHCNVRQKETYQCVLPGLGRNGADYTYDGKLGRWLANQRRFNRTQEHIGPQRTALLQSLVNEGKLSWALKESKNILKRRGDGSDEILDESKMAKKKVKRARKDGEEGDEDIEDVIDDALISDFAH